MSTALIVPLAALAAVLVVALGVVAVVVGRRMLETHRARLIAEKATGNQRVRKVMAGQVGRRSQPEFKALVRKAERMRGWVFIVVTRYPAKGLQEHVEWAFTSYGAQRKLDQWLANGGGHNRRR